VHHISTLATADTRASPATAHNLSVHIVSFMRSSA
jgi:hypothetical protein